MLLFLHSPKTPDISLPSTSESIVAQDVIDALAENGFVEHQSRFTGESGRFRKDLFDHVVTRSVEFIVAIHQTG